MIFRNLLLGIPVLALALVPVSAPSQSQVKLMEAGSGFPAVTASDQAIAAAVNLRRQNRHEEERALLIAHLEQAPRGVPETDAVVLRLAEYFPRNRSLQSEVVALVEREQLKRLMETCHSANRFALEAFFAEEYVQRYPTRSEARAVRHSLAIAHMMSDVDEKRAVEQWDYLVRNHGSTEEGRLARIHLEAINGPQSIPAFEAAYRIAEMQSRRARNPYRSIFSNDRVIGSSERPFLKQYFSDSRVSDRNKSEILHQLMFSYHQVGSHGRARDAALKILELTDYRGPYAESAAMTVCLSYWMTADYARAIDNLEWYLQVFPSSRAAARANFYKGQVHLELGQYDLAYIEFEVLKAMYPGTEHASDAMSYAGALRLHHGDKFDSARVDRETARLQQARLGNNVDPREYWTVAATSPVNRLFAEDVADVQQAREEPLRLSQLFLGESAE